MSWAAPRVEKRSSGRASSSGRPRTWSATRRALRGATRTKRALALTTGRVAGSLGFGLAFALAAGFLAAGFSAAGFFAAGFFAGALDVDFSEALLSAVLEVASAAPLPLVAVSALGFGLAAGFFAARFLAAGFFAGGFFFCSVFFFSSAIPLAPRRYRRPSGRGRSGWGRTRPACVPPSIPRCRPARACGR